jgi:hypothetical protein
VAIPGAAEADWLFTAGVEKSRLFVGLNTHFPLVSFHVSLLVCDSKK